MQTYYETSNSPSSSRSPSPTASLADALERLAHEAQNQLGTVAQTAYFLGNGLQRAVTDEVFDLFAPETWRPANLLRVGSRLTRQGFLLARGLLAPDAARLIFQELKNKIDVFTLVKNLASKLDLPSDQFVPLPDLVAKSYSLSAYEALWAVEGVGHYYTDSFWKFHGQPQGLLVEADPLVPPKSLLMLHAGMGLAFADRLVGDLTPESSASQVAATMQQFIDLCRNNSREGYVGAAIESLGLVTRDFYPDLLGIVSEQLQEIDPDLIGFFWHGAGRALYFSREYFLPGLCIWCDVDQLTTNEPDQLSAIAGLAWAVTQVNMRHPGVLENQLRLYIDESARARAFTNGAISTTLMRQDTTPDQPYVSAFIDHQPRDRDIAASWDRRITRPFRTALQSYYPVLTQHHALDQLFRYQDLGKLTEQLSGQAPNP